MTESATPESLKFSVREDKDSIEVVNNFLELSLWKPQHSSDPIVSNLWLEGYSKENTYLAAGQTGEEAIKNTAQQLFVLAATILRARAVMLEQVYPADLENTLGWDDIIIH